MLKSKLFIIAKSIGFANGTNAVANLFELLVNRVRLFFHRTIGTSHTAYKVPDVFLRATLIRSLLVLYTPIFAKGQGKTQRFSRFSIYQKERILIMKNTSQTISSSHEITLHAQPYDLCANGFYFQISLSRS